MNDVCSVIHVFVFKFVSKIKKINMIPLLFTGRKSRKFTILKTTLKKL